jgi:DNA-binding FrmR family transcriptional regulator
VAHTVRDRTSLLHRVRRLRGQLDAIERALEEECDPAHVLQQIAACRGACNGLMLQVLEGHVELHVLNPRRRPTAEQARAAEQLLELLRTYLR